MSTPQVDETPAPESTPAPAPASTDGGTSSFASAPKDLPYDLTGQGPIQAPWDVGSPQLPFKLDQAKVAETLKADPPAQRFADDMNGAVARYKEAHPDIPVTFDDPQRNGNVLDGLKAFANQSGTASFNRAPANGDFKGGAMAYSAVKQWVQENTANGKRVTTEDFILKSLEENHGNLTLAMGTCAEVLERPEMRPLAASIDGLGNVEKDKKDYYRFAGAYIGLQPGSLDRALGVAGAFGQIPGTALMENLVFKPAAKALDGEVGKALKQELDGLKALPEMFSKGAELSLGLKAAQAVKPAPIAVPRAPING